ncbi:hypothetical protein FE257_007040 [Aspergillus nanangensis]|uniref:NAD-dependent epimerase/dehydratase domain-containing protein n=1 Tax=Aspergillus nanangensis TaxID=2582783 RepID=A0AAD4CNE5_ASPNN|nr:hypothetical protein FE257_007040 [Aspergillus nanangensis]
MQHSTTIPPGGLVLITGVNGFLASHLALQLLQRGYAVKGTVRTPETASWITSAMKSHYPNAPFQAVVIPNLSAPGIMDSLLQDVSGVVYMAADTSLNPSPHEVITPGLAALQSALESAASNPSVKRFVLTSSYTAAVDTFVSPPSTTTTTITPSSWNTTSGARAWAPPPYDPPRALDVYQSLKTETEKLLWNFAREQNPAFVCNSVLPGFVIGPIVHARQRGSTAALVRAYFDDPACSQAFAWISAPWVVDVGDTALLHLAGLVEEDVRGERLLALAGRFDLQGFERAFEGIDPARSWGSKQEGKEEDKGGIQWVADTKREVAVLQRMGQGEEGFTPFLESVRRTCLEGDREWMFRSFLPEP